MSPYRLDVLLGSVSWDTLEKASSLLVNMTILIAAVAAVIKFRLFNMLAHRWRSELVCTHCDLDSGEAVFTADYSVHNTAQRPIKLSNVTLRLVGAVPKGPLLVPDPSSIIAERVCQPDDPALRGLFHIEAGERTIFTLRCRLEHLDEVVFVLCGFDLPYRRVPAAYSGFYVKVKKPSTA